MDRLKAVPRPHPAFNAYAVQVGPKNGVCFIKAAAVNIATTFYGHELKSSST